MIKTLIVDDDFLVRSYLKTLPTWETCGCTIVRDVRDGEEALQALQSESFDLLVTDISMPLLDGIALIQQVRKHNPQIYIIVLSCHDELSYVKQAMKEGADDYILKNTLDDQTLYTALQAAQQKIGAQPAPPTPAPSANPTDLQNEDDKYVFYSNMISARYATPALQRQAQQKVGIVGNFQKVAIVEILYPHWQNQALFMGECSRILQLLRAQLQASTACGLSFDVLYASRGSFCCFVDFSAFYSDTQAEHALQAFVAQCHTICQQEGCVLAVSQVCVGNHALATAYQQIKTLKSLRFYQEDATLQYNAAVCLQNQLPAQAEAFLHTLQQAQAQQTEAQFTRACEQILLAFAQEKTEPTLVCKWFRQFEHACGVEQDDTDRMVSSMASLRQRMAICIETLYQAQKVPAHVSPAIAKALPYIWAHYREQIGLQDVAQAVGVNPTYLSYLFKQEMQIGFSNYVLNHRMTCVKQLLTTTNYKIVEAASCAGFNDYHYFTRTFKKLEGISPLTYRKQHAE